MQSWICLEEIKTQKAGKRNTEPQQEVENYKKKSDGNFRTENTVTELKNKNKQKNSVNEFSSRIREQKKESENLRTE